MINERHKDTMGKSVMFSAVWPACDAVESVWKLVNGSLSTLPPLLEKRFGQMCERKFSKIVELNKQIKQINEKTVASTYLDSSFYISINHSIK